MAPNCSLTGQSCICQHCHRVLPSPDKLELEPPMMLRVFVCSHFGCPFQSDDLNEVEVHKKKHREQKEIMR